MTQSVMISVYGYLAFTEFLHTGSIEWYSLFLL